MKILVTGHAGHLGAVLLPTLLAKPDVAQVVGIDVQSSGLSHPKFKQFKVDVRDVGEDVFRDIDLVIHLAFAVTQVKHTVQEMAANNVEGSRRVFELAHRAGVKRIVNLSSVSVYGSGVNIRESAEPNPSPAFPYAEHKYQVELIGSKYPNITHLRSHFIIGPYCQGMFHFFCKSPFYLAIPGPDPLIQMIHEQDVVSAILLAADAAEVGIFNLAASESVSLKNFSTRGRKWVIPLSVSLLRFLARARQWHRTKKEIHWLDTIVAMLDTTLTVDCSAAREKLNWEPKYSLWQARNEVMSGRRPKRLVT